MSTIEIQPDTTVGLHVAEWLTDRAHMTAGPFVVCLSGGSTPKELYRQLAAAPLRDRFPWDRTHFFFGDERFVPYSHPDSNYGMVQDALLSHVPVPPDHVHPFPTDDTPDDAARRYAETLKRFYGADSFDPARPFFDVTLLGLGEDGHTASLFPGTAALKENTAWTAAVIGSKPEPRLTLTYPSLNSSKVAAFLVTGEAKRDVFARVRIANSSLPAAGVKPVGELIWFVDKTVAN